MSSNQKLNQVIAVEKGVKSRVMKDVTERYHTAQKPALFAGFQRTYAPKREDGDQQPSQSQRVQQKAPEVIKEIGRQLTELFDITATKDYANCTATADVEVDGEVLIKGAPVTFLLFVEKELTNLHTALAAMPVLDPAHEWSWDGAVELFRTKAVETASTKKVQKALTLLAPTKEHPGQAQIITEDETVGTWQKVELSGALTEDRRRALLIRIEKVQRAVKYARERANETPAPMVHAGKAVFDWLLA